MFSLARNPSSLFRPCRSSLPSVSPATLALQTGQRRHNASLRRSVKNNDIAKALARSDNLFKTYKPVTPSLRHLIRPRNDHLWPGKPLKALTVPRRKNGGRNHHGRITVRHIGGGAKQRIRIVDFHRWTPGVHDVIRIEYDPTRSAHLALIKNRSPATPKSPVWSYILATENMRAGDQVQSFRSGIPEGLIPKFDSSQGSLPSRIDTKDMFPEEAAFAEEAALEERLRQQQMGSQESLAMGLLRSITLKPGNVLPLRLCPVGTVVHNISLRPEGPGVLMRSAGTAAMIVGFEDGLYAHVRLQSGEVRKLHKNCCATIGTVSNPLWKNRSLGKAGRSRNLGIRPAVRGVAMNKNDHPHGGGRGKSKSNKHPVSPWGWLTKGMRTRKPGPKGPKGSNKMVIKERPRGKDRQKRIN